MPQQLRDCLSVHAAKKVVSVIIESWQLKPSFKRIRWTLPAGIPRRELFGTGKLSTWRHVQGDPTARLLFHPAASVVVRDKKGPDKGRMLAEGCQQAGLRRSLRKEN